MLNIVSLGLCVLWLSSSAGCHNDVEVIVQVAVKHNVCVIPFGGGLVMYTQCIHGINLLVSSQQGVFDFPDEARKY